MKKLNTFFSFFFTKKLYYKLIAYFLLVLFLYLFKDFALLFFLTFIFAYLFFSLAQFSKSKLDHFIDKYIGKVEKKSFFKKFFSINFLIVFEYIVFFSFLIIIISKAIPEIQKELTGISHTIPALGEKIKEIKTLLSDINKNYYELDTTLRGLFNNKNINYDVVYTIFSKLKSAGSIILNILFALILSFVFLLDRKKLKKYLKGLKKSNFSFLYFEYKIIFDKVIRSFGLILKAQSLIALTNSILTVIGLFIIGTIFLDGWGFPYLITLGVIVFIFGFIPVLGVFISSIPILLLGYLTDGGGFSLVLAIILLVFIIHSIEAYILNPKIVSNFLELPVSLTFIILIVGEHFFGVAGLLIGVSLFYFITELFKDIDKEITRRQRIKKLENNIFRRLKKEKFLANKS